MGPSTDRPAHLASSSRSALAGGALCALLGACSPPAGGLIDGTAASGLDFEHDSGFRETYYFPETVGSGVLLADLDDDGDLDLYAVQSGMVPGTLEAEVQSGPKPTNRLFENQGAGRFADVTASSGAARHEGYGMGVCAGDVNGDGATDIFMTAYGPDALLLNRGGFRFDDAAQGTALADRRWNTGCAFGDLDRDGHLDLVVAGYVAWDISVRRPCKSGDLQDYCHVNHFDPIGDRVWRGDGQGGFVERTRAWGLGQRRGRGFQIALIDFTDDGWLDLYVANDSVENHLYVGDGTGRLQDVTDLSGAAYNVEGLAEAGMGVAAGDVDADGLCDLLVTNFAGESNTLYLNASGGRFRDASRQSGITLHSRQPLGFGTVLGDLDRDGIEDLVVTNGHVMRHIGERNTLWDFAQPDQIFRGLPGGRFEPWPEAELGANPLATPRVGRGLAAGDLDGDGDLDLVFSGLSEQLVVVTNQLARAGSGWLSVVLAGPATNTDAVGSRVRLVLDDGSEQTRWVRSGTSFQSQCDLAPFFGIPAGKRAVRLEIRWPDGLESEHELGEVDRRLVVEHPEASGSG